MKILYCKDFNFDCCNQCHSIDEVFISYHQGYKISHCCESLTDIIKDIDNHSDKENNCE